MDIGELLCDEISLLLQRSRYCGICQISGLLNTLDDIHRWLHAPISTCGVLSTDVNLKYCNAPAGAGWIRHVEPYIAAHLVDCQEVTML